MKILIAAGFSESLTGFRLPLLKAMVDVGHEVHATAPEDDAKVREILQRTGVGFHPIPMSRAGLSPRADFTYRRSLLALMSKLKPDGFLAYTHKAVVHGLRAAAECGVSRRIGLITGLGYAFTPGGGLRRFVSRHALVYLYGAALPKATGLFFQNPDDAATFRQLGLLKKAPTPSIVAGSGIPLDQFPQVPVPPGPPVFLMLARLLQDKGVREYAAAARLIRQKHPEARFLLGGGLDANPTSISEAELKGWGAEGILEYLGNVKDVPAVLARCTTYVLPSYREGTPRSVLEAMATGRGIVTSDAPGCRETIENAGPPDVSGIRTGTNGFLVPVAQVEPLVGVCIHICQNPRWVQDSALRSRSYAERKYDVNLVNNDILKSFI